MLAREVDQGEVTRMQVAHGRHETDAQTLAAPIGHLAAQGIDGFVGIHQAS